MEAALGSAAGTAKGGAAAIASMNPDNYAALAAGAGIVVGSALSAVGNLAVIGASAGPPLSIALGPLGMAIGGVVQAASQAKGNKEEAAMLSERATDCGDKMAEVVNVCKSLPIDRAESVTRQVEHLTKTLEDVAEFLKKFSKKGFLGRMISGEVDASNFAKFDKKIAFHSNELGSALDLQNLMMQERLFAKMEEMAQLVQNQEKDPSKVAALCSGLDGDELKNELGAISEKLDELFEAGKAHHEAAMSKIDQATDRLSAEGKAHHEESMNAIAQSAEEIKAQGQAQTAEVKNDLKDIKSLLMSNNTFGGHDSAQIDKLSEENRKGQEDIMRMMSAQMNSLRASVMSASDGGGEVSNNPEDQELDFLTQQYNLARDANEDEKAVRRILLICDKLLVLSLTELTIRNEYTFLLAVVNI